MSSAVGPAPVDFKTDPIGWWHQKWDSTTRRMREQSGEVVVLDDAALAQRIRINSDWHKAVRQSLSLKQSDIRAVYFIGADNGMIKIGVALSPARRLQQLLLLSPVHLRLLLTLPGKGVAGESELHRRFAEHRSHGEWFRPATELLTFIAEQSGGER